MLSTMKYMHQKYGWLESGGATWRLSRLIAKHGYLKGVGFTGADPELLVNFDKFAQKERLEAQAYAIEPSVVAYGYGRLDRLPTIYLMKNMVRVFGFFIKEGLSSALGMKFAPYLLFENGFQSLPKAMARGLDVRLDTGVKHIARRSSGKNSFQIQITTENATEEFDRVIITATPDQILRFLDLSQAEEEIFSKVKFYYFHSILFYADNLPLDAVFPVECVEQAENGYPCTIVNYYPKNRIYLAWQLLAEDISHEELDSKLRQFVCELGGRIDKVAFRRVSIYFPHFSEEDLHELNPYERLEAMQGKKGAYFLGGLLNGETTNNCAQYAKYLMKKHFSWVRAETLTRGVQFVNL